MAVEVILPRVDMDMTEGKIAFWHVKNGDWVSKGQVVFDMETDKATMEVEAPVDGLIEGITGEVNAPLPVGKIVAWILQRGEAVPAGNAPTARAESGFPGEAAAQAQAADPTPVSAAQMFSTPEPARLLRATPLARSVARAQGMDLQQVQGSGPGGRVYLADLPQGDGGPPPPTGTDAGVHLQWFARGDGVPLVLLHGFGADLGSWRPLMAQLPGVPALGMDLPNHGKSARSVLGRYGDLARLLVERLDAEGIGALHLLGHSMGGAVALAMAGMLRDRLQSLTLLAPAGLGPEINAAFIRGLLRADSEQNLRPWLAQLFGDTSLLSASFGATAWQQLRSEPRREAMAGMAERFFPGGTQAESLRGHLMDLSVPVKLVWGAFDCINPVHQSAGLPGSVALHVFAGLGHLPHIEASAALARLVRQQMCAAAANRQ